MLPPDNHVHSEFSWDAANGSMHDSCARAVDLGLPSIAFTEHLDLAAWRIKDSRAAADPRIARGLDAHGCFHAPPIDFDAYFASIERCRVAFPDLRVLSGLEIGEPHWFPEATADALAMGAFDRVLGSLHSARVGGDDRLIDEWLPHEVGPDDDADAVRNYLAEVVKLVEGSEVFEVVAHIDYVTRQIERAGRSHEPLDFEDEYRSALRAIRGADRVLEINTRRPLERVIVNWWHDEGGAAVSFGSDAHDGHAVGHGFADAAAMAEAAGFRPQSDPYDFWCR